MTVYNGEKCWSHNNEEFNYESLEELIQWLHDDKALEVGRVVYFSIANKPDAGQFVSAESVIDNMASAAWDVGSEYAEDFPDVTPDARKELEEFLEAWARKHCEVNFFTVSGVQEYVITQADIDACIGGKTDA